MKDVFNKRQRFSLRKYSVGVCSVLLGTALFAAGANTASAAETTASSDASTSASTESASDSTVATATAASSPEASYEVPATNVNQVDTVAAQEVKAQSEANKAAEKAEETAQPAPKAEETVKPAKAEEAAQPAPKAEAPKATATSEAKKADEKSQAHSAASEAAKPVASTSAATSESSETASASEAAAVALSTTVDLGSLRSADAPTADRTAAVGPSATLDRAATDLTNAGALATSRSRRNRRAVTNNAVTGDHNTNPVAVSTYLKDGETVDPAITNPNGATVKSQEVPAGYQAKEGDWYTYSIIDLTRFNERYNTNYYTRAYKRFDDSTETTVELIDKTTGNVVETRTLSASSGIQKFTTTTAASNGQLTVKYDYNKGLGAGPGKTDEPFIQFGYEVGASIQALVNPKNEAEQKLYQDVYNARTSTDIINVVEPAYNGRTITDSNAKIPKFVEKPTYYRVVDKNNATFNANKTDKTVQDYVPNGNEVDLAKYATKAMEGQH
ncbi:YSIRK-type signal peptide-containing protein, partial [Escherichia coli]|nr:YSIRK-type signal peptide-containing protein [Escherichia coli]